MARTILPLLAALVLPLPAAAQAQNYPPAVGEVVARVRKQVRTIDVAAFKASLDRRSAGLVIDVREPAEFAQGHVPGAINVPRGQLEFKIWPHLGFPDKLDTKAKITVYCGTGSRSILAAKALQDVKLGNVTAVDMKFEDWTRAGHPVEREW